MSYALSHPPIGFDDLSVAEQVEYVQALWERIVGRAEQVPVPEWHQEILASRVAAYEADPDEGRPWEEVEADLRILGVPRS